MSAGTIRLRSNSQEDRVFDTGETVIGEMGYQWHFQSNESKVLPDNYENRTLSANATTSLGTLVQQEYSPDVLIDDDDNVAIS